MTTVVRKKVRIGTTKVASKPSSSAKVQPKAATAPKPKKIAQKFSIKPAAKMASSHILAAPKGPRTLTHREIKQAVESVFEERYEADT